MRATSKAILLTFAVLAMAEPLFVCQSAQAQTGVSGSKGRTSTMTASDQATLVILTHQGPVLADLRISVAKIPYRTWVGRFLALQMDINKDGSLSPSELNLLTNNLKRLAGISGDVFEAITAGRTLSMSPEESKGVTAVEFAEWLRDRLPRAFDLIAQPEPADDAVRLATLIDVDGNGLVGQAEFDAMFQTLRFRDLDNDETLSVAELIPYRDPRSQQAALTPDAANLPFFHVTDQESARSAAERIIRRYGHDDMLPTERLRCPSGAFQGIDGEGTISKDELSRWLLAPVFHLMMDVKLSDRSNTSDIDVTVSPESTAWCVIDNDAFGQTSLRVDGIPIRIFARGGGANNRKVTRGFLGQTFVMIDADRSQSLDESEFPGILDALQQSGASGTFEAIDLDGDLQITREELFSFTERDQMAAASRIEVSVKQDGKSLFSEIDSNKDRRLSVREVRSARQAIAKFDLNGDGSFADTEFGTEYTLTFGLGQPEIRRTMPMSSMNMMERNANAVLPGREGLAGPEWFRRMDRNQDGDVSRREFPGSSIHFQDIDTDKDGLISSDEASSVGTRNDTIRRVE